MFCREQDASAGLLAPGALWWPPFMLVSPHTVLVCSAERVGRLPPLQGLLTAHAQLNFHLLQELPQD